MIRTVTARDVSDDTEEDAASQSVPELDHEDEAEQEEITTAGSRINLYNMTCFPNLRRSERRTAGQTEAKMLSLG